MLVSSGTAVRRLRAILETARPGRIVLHPGRIKTGSTFLQNAMLENAESLREAGWIFPRSLMHFAEHQPKSRVMRSAGHAVLTHFASNAKVDLRVLDRFERELEGRKQENIIFSAEVLGRDPRDGSLRRLARVLDGFDVTVLMYLRRPSAWVSSYYVENVTGGIQREHRRFEDTSEDFRGAVDVVGFVDQCLDWHQPPDIIFRNYELARSAEGGILADFCNSIGLPALSEPEKTNINRSPSIPVVHAVRIFNALTRGLSGPEYKAVLHAGLLEKLARHDKDIAWYTLLSPELCRVIDTRWAKDNIALVAGGHISQEHYDRLTEGGAVDVSQSDLSTEAIMLHEVCDVLQRNGVNGFRMEPTASSVGRELQRRLWAGIRRRMTRNFGIRL